MTLVIGQLDADGTPHLLGDRAVKINASWTQSLAYPKVVRPLPALLVGAAGSTAWLEALHAWRPPGYLRDLSGLALCRAAALELAHAAPKGAICQAITATVNVLYPFSVLEDRSVASSPSSDGIAAVGSGALPGLAALRVLARLQTPEIRLLAAARVVGELLPGDVAGPYDLLSVEANASSTSASGSHDE